MPRLPPAQIAWTQPFPCVPAGSGSTRAELKFRTRGGKWWRQNRGHGRGGSGVRGLRRPLAPGCPTPRPGSTPRHGACSQTQDRQGGIKPPLAMREVGCYRDAGILSMCLNRQCSCWEQHFKPNFGLNQELPKRCSVSNIPASYRSRLTICKFNQVTRARSQAVINRAKKKSLKIITVVQNSLEPWLLESTFPSEM